MAKILQIRVHEQRRDGLLNNQAACRDVEETAAQIVALMQAKFSRPTASEMLQILHCTADQITAMRG